MKNKKFMTLFLLLIPILLIGSMTSNNTFFVFADSGTPDAYGDQINECSVWQSTTMKGNITYSNYTSGVQVSVDSLTATRFNVTAKLNSTFASSTVEAITNTRVYINITYTNGTTIISTTEMTDYYASLSGSYYYVKSSYTWDDATHHPIAGVTYYVWLKYEVYR